MTGGERCRNYMTANKGRKITPKQWRRVMHKYNRANGFYYGHWGEGCKGHATPKQGAAR